MLMKDQQSALTYLQYINEHIDCILRYGSDGKFHPKLIRDDYVVSSLPSIDESIMIGDPTFSRKSWIDTINEVKVQYNKIVEIEVTEIIYLLGSGQNNGGALGIGNYATDPLVPQNTAGFVDLDENGDVISDVAAGAGFSMILKSDGTIWGAGTNTQGQQGLGHKTTPVYLWEQESGLGVSWGAVSCGNNFTVALKSDGTIWFTGEDRYGVAGLGNAIDGSYTYYEDFIQIGSASDWVSIETQQYRLFAINSSGELFACGYNPYGELGLGDTTHRNALIQVGSATNWSKIGAASYGTIGLKTDGTLYTWGLASQGILGNGTTTPNIDTPTKIGTDTDWANIGSTAYCVFAIKTNGTLWGTGENSSYELGLNHQNQVNTFTQIGTDTDWEKLFGSWYAMIGIKTSGKAYGAGYTWEDLFGVGESVDNSEHEFIAIADVVSGTDDLWTKFSTWGSNHFIGVRQ